MKNSILLLLLSLLSCETFAQGCTYFPVGYSDNGLLINGNVMPYSVKSSPKRIDFVGTQAVLPSDSIHVDSLIGFSIQGVKVDFPKILLLVQKAPNIKYIVFNNCEIDSLSVLMNSQVFMKLDFIQFESMKLSISENIKTPKGISCNLFLKNIELLDDEFPFVFNPQAITLDNVIPTNWEQLIINMLKSDVSCVVFRFCDLRGIESVSIKGMKRKFDDLGFDVGCKLRRVPKFVQNVEEIGVLSFSKSSLKVHKCDYFPNVKIIDHDQLTNKERRLFPLIFPNAWWFQPE